MDNSNHLVTLKLTLSGFVQGVGMRFYIRNTAISFGIKGSVENLYTGDVECICQGPQKQIDLFISDLKENHPGNIDSFKIKILNTHEIYDDFDVKLSY